MNGHDGRMTSASTVRVRACEGLAYLRRPRSAWHDYMPFSHADTDPGCAPDARVFPVCDAAGFADVEACVTRELLGEGRCAFLRSGDFARLRRLALYGPAGHAGAVARAPSGLCVRLAADNSVWVGWGP